MNLEHPKLPQFPIRFLRWFCDPDILEDVEGDLADFLGVHIEELTEGAFHLHQRHQIK